MELAPAIAGLVVLANHAAVDGRLSPTSVAVAGTALVLGTAALSRRSPLGLLGPAAIFFVGGLLYSLPSGIAIATAGELYDERALGDSVIGRGTMIVFVAYGAALVGAGLAPGRRRNLPLWLRASAMRADLSVGTSAMAVGVLAMLLLLSAVGGAGALAAVNYGERYLLLDGLGPLVVGFQVLIVGTLVTVATLLHHNRVRAALVASLIGLLVLGWWTAISGSRTSTFQLSVGLLGLLQASGRRIRAPVLLLVGVVAMVAGFFFGAVRGGAELGSILGDPASIAMRLNPSNQEFGTAVATTGDIASAVPAAEPYHLGATIPRSLGVLVPRALWPERPESLPEWYVRRFYPNVAEIGGGYAFSPVAEAWLNFGMAGVVMSFLAIGALLRAAECRLTAPMPPWAACLVAALLPWLFVFARLDSATMLKSIGVNVVAVLLAAFAAGRLLAVHSARHRSAV